MPLKGGARRQRSWCVDTAASSYHHLLVLKTCGSLPRKQSPAHSVAFCNVSELGETKAACWTHSKPTGTGCFPPGEGRTEVPKRRAEQESSSLGHLPGSPGEEGH